MELFEIKFIKIEYIYFLLLMLVDFLFRIDKLRIALKPGELSNGANTIIFALSSMSVGIIFFISEIFNAKKNVIRQNETTFTQKLKKAGFSLIPGVLEAVGTLFYLATYLIPIYEYSWLSVSLELVVQLIGFLIGIHLCSVIILKMKTFISMVFRLFQYGKLQHNNLWH